MYLLILILVATIDGNIFLDLSKLKEERVTVPNHFFKNYIYSIVLLYTTSFIQRPELEAANQKCFF